MTAMMVVVPGSSEVLSSRKYAAIIISATAAAPAATRAGNSNRTASAAHAAPNRATSAKVLNPALAVGLRSRSRPISRPMPSAVRNSGSESRPCSCSQPYCSCSIRFTPVSSGLPCAKQARSIDILSMDHGPDFRPACDPRQRQIRRRSAGPGAMYKTRSSSWIMLTFPLQLRAFDGAPP